MKKLKKLDNSMQNIKSVKMISPMAGLEIGDVLTRPNPFENFELNDTSISVDKMITCEKKVRVSPFFINKNNSIILERFNEDPIGDTVVKDKEDMLNEVIGKLVELDNEHCSLLEKIDNKISELKERILELEKSIESQSTIDRNSILDKLEELTVLRNGVILLEELK